MRVKALSFTPKSLCCNFTHIYKFVDKIAFETLNLYFQIHWLGVKYRQNTVLSYFNIEPPTSSNLDPVGICKLSPQLPNIVTLYESRSWFSCKHVYILQKYICSPANLHIFNLDLTTCKLLYLHGQVSAPQTVTAIPALTSCVLTNSRLPGLKVSVGIPIVHLWSTTILVLITQAFTNSKRKELW